MNSIFDTGGAGKANTHDWLTPPELLSTLGPFDLDPCASEHQPWRTATEQFTIRDDGLSKPWSGLVWCNPPYGAMAARWLERCADHGNAIALVFARTETAMFQDHVWAKAWAVLFLRGRVYFRLPGGGRAGNAGAPSVLVAYGREAADRLEVCGLDGAFIRLKTRGGQHSLAQVSCATREGGTPEPVGTSSQIWAADMATLDRIERQRGLV